MFSSLALAAVVLPLHAQDSGSQLAQAFSSVMESSRDAMANSNLGFKPGLSVFGAYLRPKGTVRFTSEFLAGRKYVVAAGGNDDAEKVGVTLLDEAGKVLAKDSGDDPYAAVALQNTKRRKVSYQLSNGGTKPIYACLSVMVDRDGWDLHPNNLKAVVEKCRKLSSFAKSQGYRFYTRAGSWCLYGGLVEEQASLRATKLNVTNGDHAVIGFCDGQASILSLSITNSSGEAIGSDSSTDLFPVYEFPGGYSGLTDIALQNGKGSASMAMFGLFEKP